LKGLKSLGVWRTVFRFVFPLLNGILESVNVFYSLEFF